MEYLVTQKELAKALHISARQIRNLILDNDMFKSHMEGKQYKLLECVPEFYDYKYGVDSAAKKVSLEKTKTEHELLKMEVTKFKLKSLKRETHYAADVESYLSDMLVRFRETLMQQPQKIALQITGEKDANKIILALEKAFNEALSELSGYDGAKINRQGKGSDDDDEDGDDDLDDEDDEGEE